MNMFGSFPGKALVVHIKLTGPKEPTTLWNQGVSRIFMQSGEPRDHGICAQDDKSF
jgi:hypothetical protein